MDLLKKLAFEESLDQASSFLDDLRSLAGPDLHKVIDQVEWQHRQIVEAAQGLEVDEDLSTFIEGQILEKIEKDLRSRGLSVRPYYFIEEHLGVFDWKNIYKVTEFIPELVRLFIQNRPFEIQFNRKKIILRSTVDQDMISKISQSEVDRLTKAVFKERCLLTYKVEEEGEKTTLSLIIDMCHEDQGALQFEVADKFTLELSSHFEKFLLKTEDVNALGKHYCFELTEHMKLVQKNVISQRYRGENGQLEGVSIFHFPFLFRPVSIIIPCERHVKIRYKMSDITPSDEFKCNSLKSGRIENKKGSRFFLDLFEVLNQ